MFRKEIFILIMLAVIFLVGCQPASPAASSEPDKITVQFSWFHTAEFAGFYVADQKGYYAEENLDVTLVPGGPTVDPVEEVVSGQADFGTVAGDHIIRAQLAGQDVVAVASIFQHSPLVVMTLADSGIQNPYDLIGKTVGVISPAMDTTWDIQFLAMLDRLDIDPAEISFVTNESFHGADDLLSDRMDAASGYFWTNEPVQAQLEGHDVVSLFYSDYGVEIYANAIFTTDSFIQEQPDLVERFVRATRKGYQYALEHPEEAGKLALEYDDSLDPEFQAETMRAQVPLIDTGDVPIGWMKDSIWQSTLDVLLEQEIIASSVEVDTLYTNQFIEQTQ